MILESQADLADLLRVAEDRAREEGRKVLADFLGKLAQAADGSYKAYVQDPAATVGNPFWDVLNDFLPEHHCYQEGQHWTSTVSSYAAYRRRLRRPRPRRNPPLSLGVMLFHAAELAKKLKLNNMWLLLTWLSWPGTIRNFSRTLLRKHVSDNLSGHGRLAEIGDYLVAEVNLDSAEYVGDGENGVYYDIGMYDDDWYVSAVVDTPHFVDFMFKDDGPYEGRREALAAGRVAAGDWCYENNVRFEGDEEE